MPTRIAYWTSAFEVGMEAVASEVATLRKHFPSSVAWGLSDRRWALIAPRLGQYCLHPRMHLLFRGATRLLEPLFDLNHVVGSAGDWAYLMGKRRRPTVLTVACDTGSPRPEWIAGVDRFAVEFESARESLIQAGANPRHIRTIFPPVDLDRFVPSGAPDGPFTVVFASSPERADWLEARGVPALLDAAALRPAMRFRLLWRPWGDSLPAVQALVRDRGLENVEILPGRFADMPAVYRDAHVTAAPFAEIERCKPAPNSLVESLACGRPVLTTAEVGLAALIRETSSGAVVVPRGPEIAEGLDKLRADWHAHSASARRLAERWFSLERFVRGYGDIYENVLNRPIVVASHLKKSA